MRIQTISGTMAGFTQKSAKVNPKKFLVLAIAGMILAASSCSQQSGTTRLVVDTGATPGVSLSSNGSMPENVASLQLIVLDQDNVAAMQSLGDDENMTMEDFIALFLAYRNFGRDQAVSVDIDTGKNVVVGLSAMDANGKELYFGFADNITVSGAEMNIPIVMDGMSPRPEITYVTSGSGSVLIIWTGVPGAVNYVVEHCEGESFLSSSPLCSATTNLSCSQTTYIPGTYYIRIKANFPDNSFVYSDSWHSTI